MAVGAAGARIGEMYSPPPAGAAFAPVPIVLLVTWSAKIRIELAAAPAPALAPRAVPAQWRQTRHTNSRKRPCSCSTSAIGFDI